MKLTKESLDKLEVLIDELDDVACLDSTTINDIAHCIRVARKKLKTDSLHLVSICEHNYEEMPRSQWFKDGMKCTKCGDVKLH